MFISHLILVALLSFVRTTNCQAQNVSSLGANGSNVQNQTYTGWQAGPSTRGTLDIVWTCLTAIFACSWTILHLNVPMPCEPKWKAPLRKAKWMALTILFPEFIFSKAVSELKMAIDDLHDMHELHALKKTAKGEDLEWTVEYDGTSAATLYKIFHYFDKSECNPPQGSTCTFCHPVIKKENSALIHQTKPESALTEGSNAGIFTTFNPYDHHS